jgi:multidrug efflux pump
MSFTDIFVKRPVLAICCNLIILIAGVRAYDNLTTRQYPRSDIAAVTVTTAYVGADADLVRGFVTTPLERVIASADGIDYLESSSEEGRSTITVRLKLNYDTNAALTQVQSKVAQVRNDLPPEAESPVINVELADNRFASMYISFFSDQLEQNQITDYLTRVVQPKLSAVAGVQKAEILGARTFAMRVWLKADRLAAHGITAQEVAQALRANNYLTAIGSTKGSEVTVSLAANTDLRSVEEFKNLVVVRRGDSLIRLNDLADVVLGAENYDQEVRFDGKTATFMGVWALPTANSLDVVAGVRAVLPEIERALPAGMRLAIPYDSTIYIRDAINDVIRTLLETILIVVVVIFLFIGSIRSVLVPVVAIPLSLVGAIGLMYVFGFSINLLTLLAIVLSVGLVVDDAIVMLENVERHIRSGMAPVSAAITGARELVGPTVAMTLTLATVYAPIGLQGGLTGTLFREFAFTLAGAVVVSGLVALTLSPMMSSRLIRGSDHESPLATTINRGFTALQRGYLWILDVILPSRGVLAGIGVGVILLIPLFYAMSGKELAPLEDQGVVFGIVQAAPNATIEQTSPAVRRVFEAYRKFPEYNVSFQLTSPTGGFSGMRLKPWSERSRTAQQLQEQLFPQFGMIPGIRVIATTPPALPGGGQFPVEFVISSTDEPRLIFDYANQIVAGAMASKSFMFLDADLKYDKPRSDLVINRDKVGLMGLNLQQVGRDLSTMLGGNYTNRFAVLGRSYKVIPQLERTSRLTPDQLLALYVPGPANQPIPLASIAGVKNSVQPRQLNRFQQLNSAKIQGAFIPRPDLTLDKALAILEAEAEKVLPRSYVVDYAGEARQLRREGNTLVTTLILSVILIYLVLAAQFESFRDPLIILLGSVPLALSGALAFPFLEFTTINIYSQVGLVTLVGLVAKNGILIVEFANTRKNEGMSKLRAVREAAATRLRPILMTSVATVVGHFPLILASGPGAAARNSIGIVLVTGMLVGTFFTLFLVPCLYAIVSSEAESVASE